MIMTIDEAIVECKQNDLYQYAEWLEELREHRNIGNIERYNKGYKNAIDDFVISIKGELNRFEVKNLDTCVLFDLMNRKAEQLKGSISSENTNK